MPEPKPLAASWDINGQVVEKRKLTSQKNKDWAGYVVKLGIVGMMFEVTCDEKDFNQMQEGQTVHVVGRFEEYGGRLRLLVDRLGKAA